MYLFELETTSQVGDCFNGMKGIVNHFCLFAVAGTLFWAPPTGAAKLGDPAPSLQVTQWIRCEPVNLNRDKGKAIYVLIFWDSGCNACQAAVPDLVSLQNKFRSQGVVLVCITPEPADAIEKFTQVTDDQRDFAIASDENGKTYQAYMSAFGRSSV